MRFQSQHKGMLLVTLVCIFFLNNLQNVKCQRCGFKQWVADYKASSFCKYTSCSQQLDRADDKLKEFPSFPEEMKHAIKAIYLYTDDSPKLYDPMNKVLRGEQIPEQDIFKTFADILIIAIDTICKQVHGKCAINREAFRGQNYKETFTRNSDYLFKSYTSTSTDISEALHFAGEDDGSVLFHISGVNGIFIKEYSRFPRENEILMKPRTTFNIDAIYQSSRDVVTFLDKYNGRGPGINPQTCIELSKPKEPSAKCSSLTSSGVSIVTMQKYWLLKTISFLCLFGIY